jgi:hypothetical protein
MILIYIRHHNNDNLIDDNRQKQLIIDDNSLIIEGKKVVKYDNILVIWLTKLTYYFGFISKTAIVEDRYHTEG